MKVLVAGGAGFIGSHLCKKLLDSGKTVIAVDNLVTGREENMIGFKDHGQFRFIEADISQPFECDSDVEQIYNLASPASPKDFTDIPIEILRTGSLGQENLLQMASKVSARILFASTSEVYGDAQVHPQPETYFGNVNSIGERSCYDEAKRFGEAMTMAYRRMHKTNTCIARIFNTYGPHMSPDDGRILPNFFSQALTKKPLTVYGDGSQTRSYCFVSDLVGGLIALMESDEYLPVNLGNPIEKTVLEMAEIVNQLAANDQGIITKPLPENDPKQRRPDISRAKEKLNWQPTVDLPTGLEKTFTYFKSVVPH